MISLMRMSIMTIMKMKTIRVALTAGVLSLALVGCGDMEGLWASQRPKDSQPSIHWVSGPTEILDLRGPSTATVGTAVELTVQAVIGSSSCNRAGEVSLEVDDAARRVTVRATRLTAQSDGELPCTDDYGWKAHKVAFTPKSVGRYLVTAEGFRAGSLPPGEPAPQGELEIAVGEP